MEIRCLFMKRVNKEEEEEKLRNKSSKTNETCKVYWLILRVITSRLKRQLDA